jgi:hypothetical protein
LKNSYLIILTVFAVALLCTNCANAREASTGAKKAVRDSLKDPYSARFGAFTQIGDEACITVNAKNVYGGYVGDRQVSLYLSDGKWVVANFLELTHKECVDFFKSGAEEARNKKEVVLSVIKAVKEADNFQDVIFYKNKRACIAYQIKGKKDGEGLLHKYVMLEKRKAKWIVLEFDEGVCAEDSTESSHN